MVSLVGGADEAGRGCIVGPLVVAGVSATRSGVRELKELGVRDSKRLSPRQRETLYAEILKVCSRAYWAHIEPAEIDTVVRTGKKFRRLNYLEALYFAKVIDQLDASRVTVDACDSVPKRFQENICDNLKTRCSVSALHKADRDYPIVSAASIIAKVERDREVEKLRRKHGDFGSGYPSDPYTRTFFIERMRRGEPLPEYVRKSWKTWERLRQRILAPF
ncbi:MAG: ribonuclease HII [Nitrososphaerales archaeon]|jgi:ribonuclease HII